MDGSSYSFDRPDYIALESFLISHKKGVSYLIVMDHDRFSRNLPEALTKIIELEKKFGVKVLSVGEPVTLDTQDPATFLNRAFKYLMANHELIKIRQRTKHGLRSAMESGRVVTPAPFGYLNIRDAQGKATLQVDEGKRKLVMQIFHDFVDGLPLKTVSTFARENGFSNKSKSAVPRILSNPIYAGLLRLPANEQKPEKIIRAIHEPIVSECVFWTAYEKISGRTHRSIPVETMPLRGVLRCTCGKAFTGGFSKGKKKYYLYYRCSHGPNLNFPGNAIHSLLNELLRRLSLTAEQLSYIKQKTLTGLQSALHSRSKELIKYKSELRTIEQKIDKLEERLVNDEIEGVTYKKWLAKLSVRQSFLKAEIARLNCDAVEKFDTLDGVLSRMTDLEKLFEGLSLKHASSGASIQLPDNQRKRIARS